MRLAARGHHVTIVDHAPAMLSAATERAAAGGPTELITCVQADVAAQHPDLATGQFDVVLCHNHLRPARPRLPGRTALRHPRLLLLHHRRGAQVRPGLLRPPRTTGARHHRAPALHAHRATLPVDGAEAEQQTDGSSRSSCRHVDRERPKTVARCRCEVAQ
ncbi:class I SAM-dependent methyltransferase [Streptomyces cellulosae]